MLIALDTSTAWCGVALYDQREDLLLDERIWHTGVDHCRQLLPEVDAMLRAHALGPTDLTAVAVARGPGTFNGVRVAVSTAKLIAYARGLPIVGVDTLEIYAQMWRGTGLKVRPMLGAARGEMGTALWRAGDEVERIEATSLASPDDVLVTPPDPTVFVGEMEADWRRRAEGLGPTAVVASPAQSARRPTALAELAAARIRRGVVDEVDEITPIYLRPPHITQPRR